MKEQWDRQRPHLDLDTLALTALAEPFLPGHRVVSASRLVGGLANTLYTVDVAGFKQPLVLRLYTRDHTACQKDVDIYQLVHGKLPVPELFYADTKGTANGIPYTIAAFERGSMLSHVLAQNDTATIDAVMRQVGQQLAKLSTFSWQHSGFFGSKLEILQPVVFNGETHTAYIVECLFDKGGAHRIGGELAQRVSTFLATHAQVLDELEGQATLVHADFNPYNILVQHHNDRWQVAAILDWEFAFAGPALFDVGNMLRNEHRLPSSFASQFIAGFREAGGRLPGQWRKQAKLLDLLNLCDLLLQPQLDKAMVSDLAELIRRTTSQAET